ncbi:MAG: hypothetical protein QOE40_3044, partial [Actinomycetota bacterium]|nr:hypothetical protein [Actinomycetota bacterium]
LPRPEPVEVAESPATDEVTTSPVAVEDPVEPAVSEPALAAVAGAALTPEELAQVAEAGAPAAPPRARRRRRATG